MTWIKICGLREPEHAIAAIAGGADLLGLVFYPPSHRYLTPEAAADVVRTVRQHTDAAAFCGVFVDEPIDFVLDLADRCELEWVQAGGDESWDYCAEVARHRRVLKSIRVPAEATIEDVRARLAEGEDLIRSGRVLPLLDTSHAGYYGGTGRTFDWAVAADLAREYPFFLAGGLTPENARAAVRAVRPHGLDVSSGVETDRRKDSDKIRRFIEAARGEDDDADLA